MGKVLGLDDWIFDKAVPDSERMTQVGIHLLYPDTKVWFDLTPPERKARINLDQSEKFQKLIDLKLSHQYTVIGEKRNPRGIKIKITYTKLQDIANFDFIGTIHIESIDYATKIKSKPTLRFFCVKMTVAVEVEGHVKGMQTIEDRFVIIKAKSSDDAYNKLEKKKDDYAEPYLNSDGGLVRWKIESFDDCYETYIQTSDDFNKPEGVEVYSKLRGRRIKPANHTS